MNILMASPEFLGIAKTGGLADAVAGLSKGLAKLGHDVRAVIPKYSCVDPEILNVAEPIYHGMLENFGDYSVLKIILDTIPIYLIQTHGFSAPDRSVYSDVVDIEFNDDGYHFSIFSSIISELSSAHFYEDWKVDVINLHDWTVGLVPFYLSRKPHRPKTVMTIHNLAFQGLFPFKLIHQLGLNIESFSTDFLEYFGKVSLLKAGVLGADELTTVSPNYAKELFLPTLGMGFEGIFQSRQKPLYGILNAVDFDIWDPAIDPYLPMGFDENNLHNRRLSKIALQKEVGIAEDIDSILISHSSRLVHQKMVDLIVQIIPRLFEQHEKLQIAVVGHGDKHYEQELIKLAAYYPNRLGLNLNPGENSFHLAAAGGDMHLHAARFEPCGLAQQYALRYGCVPLASKVGGLCDTVFDPKSPDEYLQKRNGFLIEGTEQEDIVHCINRSVLEFEDQRAWKQLQLAAMSTPRPWISAAREYENLFIQTLNH